MSETHFTCTTCGVFFLQSDLQRMHMKSDWHRYNLKRKIVNLPVISALNFNDKVLNQKKINREEEVKNFKKGYGNNNDNINGKINLISEINQPWQICKICGNKKFTSLASYENHLKSLKHKKAIKDFDNRSRSTNRLPILRDLSVDSTFSNTLDGDIIDVNINNVNINNVNINNINSNTDTEINQIDLEIEKKLKTGVKLTADECLLCRNKKFTCVDENVKHMTKIHGLFIPEEEYLINLEGLITYLGEKIGIGKMCLSCNYEGKSIEAVRSHIQSKEHFKIPYDTEDEKLEISDYYDFTSSYENNLTIDNNDNEEWEDVSDEEFDNPYISGMELHLPSGAHIGHRSLARYYRQSLRPTIPSNEGQRTLIAAQVRSPSSMLSLSHMSTSSYNKVAERIKKEAWKEEKKFDNKWRRRETKFVNHQKHFRDELLQ